jgi:hypothetical protein
MQSFLTSSLRKGAVFQTPLGQSWLIHADYRADTGELAVLHLPMDEELPLSESWTITTWSVDSATNKLYAAYSEREYVLVKSADFDQIKSHRMAIERVYLHLTNHTLPMKAEQAGWPIQDNHCFQRVLLDHLFQRVWYDALPAGNRPAYKQLDNVQLGQLIWQAWQLIHAEKKDVVRLNQQSLFWRKAK